MKLTTTALPLLATTAQAFTTPVIRPMVPSTDTFNVTTFSAYSVIQDPTWSFTHFYVSVTTLTPPYFCTSYTTTPASHTIGSFPQTNCTAPSETPRSGPSNDTSVSFTLIRTEDKGAELTVFQKLAPTGPGLRKGTFKIPAGWFAEKEGKSEDFVGPQSFFIGDLELVSGIWEGVN